MPTPEAAGNGSPDALQTALSGYLSVLAEVADCVGKACPEIGSPYRQRLHRLRKRLAFQMTPVSLEESVIAVTDELHEYAERTSGYINQHGTEFGQTISSLEETIHTMAQRQEFYGARLRQFAAQMEHTSYPSDPEHIAEIVALQVSGLLSVVDSMNHEAHSLVTRMQSQLEAAEQRLADSEIADPITGLLTRHEMERQIATRSHAADPVLLRFVLTAEGHAEPPAVVLRTAGEKLTGHFRHRDLIARWNGNQFLVLFAGAREVAERRAGQAIPWLAGSYPLENGRTAEVRLEAGLVTAQELRPAESESFATTPGR